LATEKSGLGRKGMKIYKKLVENVSTTQLLQLLLTNMDISMLISQKNILWPLSER